MSAVPSTSDLQQLLAPLPLAALGWLCVGFHIADAPGRADTILALLVRAGLAAAPYATRQVVSDVLARVLARAPHLITVSVQDTSLLVPSLRREALHPLARFVHDFAPLAWSAGARKLRASSHWHVEWSLARCSSSDASGAPLYVVRALVASPLSEGASCSLDVFILTT